MNILSMGDSILGGKTYFMGFRSITNMANFNIFLSSAQGKLHRVLYSNFCKGTERLNLIMDCEVFIYW